MSTPKDQRWRTLEAVQEYHDAVLRVVKVDDGWRWLVVTSMNHPKIPSSYTGLARDEKEAKLKARRKLDSLRRLHALTL